MNKILLTGSTGLLGTNLAIRLRRHYEVYTLLNNRKIFIPGTKNNTENITRIKELEERDYTKSVIDQWLEYL